MKMAVSAAKCHVIADAEAEVIGLDGMRRIADADQNAGQSTYHPDLLPALNAAASQAAEEVKTAGCGYWMDNANAVAAIRSAAALATSP